MKKILIALAAAALAVTLTGCGLTAEELHQAEKVELERQAELAQTCQEAGGRYVLTTPPGKVSSGYWCLWDEESEGGEW